MSASSNNSEGSVDSPGLWNEQGEHKFFEWKLLTIADEERRRIGQELHDVMGQELVGMAFMTDALLEAIGDHSSREVQLAEKLKTQVNRLLRCVRTEAWGLIPIEIEAHELPTALARLSAQIRERFGVICEFTCDEPVSFTKRITATNLIRIAQEAVTNAIKHGRARRITISLRQSIDQVILQVEDDGHGMNGQTPSSTGQGLQIMRYRAGVIDATLSIQQLDGNGVRVICTVPRRRNDPVGNQQ